MYQLIDVQACKRINSIATTSDNSTMVDLAELIIALREQSSIVARSGCLEAEKRQAQAQEQLKQPNGALLRRLVAKSIA